jgi:hypothetical protein
MLECGKKGFRSSSIILTSSVTKLYRDTPCTSILLAGGKGYALYAHAAGCGKDTPCMPILLEVKTDTLCTSLLLLVESDTPCTPKLLEVEIDTPFI